MAADPHSLVAPYALHALDDEEARTFEEHLAACERCREELAGMREAAAGLAYNAAGPPPPPELKERILAEARSERPNVASLPARRRSWTAPLAAAAAVAAAVAIGVGVWSATRPASMNAFTQVLAQPGARVITMGEQGALAVAPNGKAALVLRVPKAPSGKTYEAWVIRDDAIRPAGLFGGGGDPSVLKLSRRVPHGAVIGVTVEKSGGARQPTQKPFVATAEMT
ncbi:MAG: anti-sigma factor domain-containing protein [Gaiellaceae bacterium]